MPPTSYGSIQQQQQDDCEEQNASKAQCTTLTELSDSDAEDNNTNNANTNDSRKKQSRTNEEVLNVAFLSFVGLTVIQAFFALMANSQSMLADCAAMTVDAVTYLFNMCAERVKNEPPTEAQLELPLAVREHRLEMKRLYLELFPPLISVITLICVTIAAMSEACESLFGDGPQEEEDVDAWIMLSFACLNLFLDAFNVHCFAQAHQAYGFQRTYDGEGCERCRCNQEQATEYLKVGEENGSALSLLQGNGALTASEHVTRDTLFEKWFGKINLNMCSAWTHICADTMRTAAVLVAAALACIFKEIPADTADSCAAIAVSITILLSLIPLIRGLFVTARQIVIESKNKPAFIMET